MVIRPEPGSQPGVSGEDCVGRGAIGTHTCRDEALERRQLVGPAVSEQPGRDLRVAMELRDLVRCGAVGAPAVWLLLFNVVVPTVPRNAVIAALAALTSVPAMVVLSLSIFPTPDPGPRTPTYR